MAAQNSHHVQARDRRGGSKALSSLHPSPSGRRPTPGKMRGQSIASILQKNEPTFAQALKTNSTLITLLLASCNIKDKDTAILATTIQKTNDESDP